MRSRDKKIINFISSRAFTFLLLAIITLVGLAFYRDYQNQSDINNELNTLRAQIDDLQTKKVKLANLVDILKSTNYVEKEARLRLGLKKPGEKVISVPDNARPKPQVLGASTELQDERSNALKWFDYFFSKSIE